MEKKKAIAKIVLISLLAALLIVFSIISFTPANSVKGFSGFAGAITEGVDLDGGIYANYSPEKIGEMTDEEYKSAVNSTFDRINSLIEQKGYEDSKVYLTSNNQIRIETPNVDDAEAVLTLIGSGEFSLKIGTNEDRIYGRDVTSSFAMQDPSSYNWGTYIGFSEEAGAILEEKTKNASSSAPVYLYFYRGDSSNYFFYLSITSQITDNFLFISSSNGTMTQENAIDLAIQISTGCFETIVEATGSNGEISASAGNQAVLGLIIAGSVLALAIIIIFAIVYRELGLMAMVSILLYIGVTLFFMQAIPVVSLSVGSLSAVLVGLILISACHFIMLEKVRGEYRLGKKLKTSIKTGYKKSVAIIAEICSVLAITSLIAFFVCTGAMKSFSMVLLICSALSALTTLFFTYHLNISYSEFNGSNGKRVNFTREETVDEIE